MDTTKAITHLSLCSGYEGIGLGLRRVLPNLREIAYVEREGFPVANLVAKMEAGELDAAPVFTDVKTFPYRRFRGCVDICSFGFPCQPFSAAGKRQATEDPRHLFPYIADGIRECQPRIVFGENVQGILSCKTGDGEPVLQYVLRELEAMGYRATAGIFSAEEVGAPHQRKRVFIMGYASSNERRDICRQQSEQEQSSQRRVSDTGTELVNSNGDGHSKHSETQKEESIWGSEATTMSRSEELANSNGKGLEGVWQRNNSQGREASDRQFRSGNQIWPSRPGEPQYDWEEPRVVADTKHLRPIQQQHTSRHREGVSEDGSFKETRVVVNTTSKGLEGSRGSSLQGTDEGLTSTNRDNGEAEPQLGRTSNGSTCGVDATANRVDRLRLLGNGVVNQTAAKAFVTLINRLI